MNKLKNFIIYIIDYVLLGSHFAMAFYSFGIFLHGLTYNENLINPGLILIMYCMAYLILFKVMKGDQYQEIKEEQEE